MEEENNINIRFNQILHEKMGTRFSLKPLPLDAEFARKYPDNNDKSICLQSELLACTKTAGIRIGSMDFRKSMIVHFGSIPPASGYNFPILGFTFAYANKYLIVVLDLHPVAKEREYMEEYIEPLKDISQKYQWIPKIEGGRSEVHGWAKAYDSGYSLYRWCDRKYLPNIEEAFKDYLDVFCDCIGKAELISDPDALLQRDNYMEKYRYDYATKDPGGAPLKSHFGEEWAERYIKEFLFA